MLTKRMIAVFYGALIFLSYYLIKTVAQDNFAFYFTASSGVCFFVLLPFLKKPVPQPFAGIMIRGTLYATTNFLLLTAQKNGEVSSSLVASLVGSMCISVPQLVKPIRTKNMIILGSLLMGSYLLKNQISISYLALIAGIVQAFTFLTASKTMRVHQTPIVWNLAAGFGAVLLMGLTASFFVPEHYHYSTIQIMPLLLISLTLVASQTAFFHLYRNFSSDEATRYSLGRIPWSYFMESAFFGKIIPIEAAIGATFISIASFLRKERRDTKR